ncbi:MAG: phosphopantothenoylcysteine decarboxylase [Thermoguttaceae bacterium]|nr:phosphopantothenoylcysteine decarboxylase [Thermoguttaceae bacterium]
MEVKREILIGVTAGIAAYKTCDLVSRLVKGGYGVSVVMTENATHLVAPRTFQALTGRCVSVQMFQGSEAIPHIDPGRNADLLCVAPATANFLGKVACGLADDLLSTLYLAFSGPVLLAPAMNCQMWAKPSVQRNVCQLLEDGVQFIGPETGRLACGEEGAGRMAEPEQIFKRIQELLSDSGKGIDGALASSF